MIYHLTLINGGCSNIGQYFVDSSRLDLTNPDHAAFGMFLVTASNDPIRSLVL